MEIGMTSKETQYTITVFIAVAIGIYSHYGNDSIKIILDFLTSPGLDKEHLSVDTTGWYCTAPSHVNAGICRPVCHNGSFGLYGMNHCRKLLSCEEIALVQVGRLLDKTSFMQEHEGRWLEYPVMVSKLHGDVNSIRFQHQLNVLKELGPSQWITQLVGFCRDVMVTQLHSERNLYSLEETLIQAPEVNTMETRYRFCMEYVDILAFMHSSHHGSRIMCGANSLEKTLDIMKMSNDFHLVLSDLSEFQLINRTNNETTVCGTEELKGDYIAPEQRWPYTDKAFKANLMKGYTEKVDIWKVPDVCKHFLGNGPGSMRVKLQLLPMFDSCKAVDPTQRPTANQIHDFMADLGFRIFGLS